MKSKTFNVVFFHESFNALSIFRVKTVFYSSDSFFCFSIVEGFSLAPEWSRTGYTGWDIFFFLIRIIYTAALSLMPGTAILTFHCYSDTLTINKTLMVLHHIL